MQPSRFEAAAHLAAIVESADDAIISKTLDGTISSWNKGAQRIFGYTAEEIVGEPIFTLIPPDRHGEEVTILRKIRAGERIEHYQTVRRRKDGSLVEISLTVSPIKTEDGSIVGASKIAREMTDMERAAAELRASEKRYRTLFESIDEGFCIIQMLFDEAGHPTDYRFLESNPAFEKHIGQVGAEGKTARELFPNLEEHWFQIYGKVALTGEATRFVEGSEVMNRWFDVYAFPVGETGSGKVALLFNNITTRKQAEAEREELVNLLEAERSKLAYLFTHAPAFVATVRGPEHIFELANPAYHKLIGHRDVIGKSVREALPEVEGQGFFEILDQVFQTGKAFTGRELPLQLQMEPDGPLEERCVNFVYQPVFAPDGKVSGIFAHGIDITEQVQARKEAETANRAKDEFLATLSHELRTPLTAIMGWARMISDDGLEEDVKAQGVEVIQRSAQLQAQLIEDILDVSRIITGKLRLDVRPIELAPIVDAAVESVLPAAQAKNIELQRSIDTRACLVSGDQNRLQQVIWNLLTNAIKFTPKGGEVKVSLERVGSHIKITVADTGAGISSKVLPYIFDRFRQADSASTRQHGGLGLGLAIVRHLIEMHGGTVEAESAGEGQGTTFTVNLPVIALASAEELTQASQKQEKSLSGEKGLQELALELEGIDVLVVDDEEDGRNLIATVLRKCGAQVTAVGSAADALTAVQELRPNVLLSDLGMPGEDGYSLIKKVRSLSEEEGGKIPAAALTAYAGLDDRMRVLRSGFQIHLPKPIEIGELVAVVANLAGRHG